MTPVDPEPSICHDCHAKPGEQHESGCDVERCSVCGGQWISCGHEDHDPTFSRWTGYWPGHLEATALGMDLNTLYESSIYKLIFIKPVTR